MKLLLGDCFNKLKDLPSNSVDSLVTDPPYGWSFMGKKWDYNVPNVDVFKEVLRVLKPGAHGLVACGTRTQHRMAVNIEDAGFEIRDIVAWVYGSGFPKSLNIGKAINKIDGVEFVSKPASGVGFMNNDKEDGYHPTINQLEQVGESSDRAKQWEGWGTALKPAMELWTLCRKPLSEKTVAKNVLKWGTGGINIDGCRVEGKLEGDPNKFSKTDGGSFNKFSYAPPIVRTEGRFPANLIHDGNDEVVGLFPETKPSKKAHRGKGSDGSNGIYGVYGGESTVRGHDDNGGSASRFFYTAKASKSERNKGLEGFEKKQNAGSYEFRTDGSLDGKPTAPKANFHPTVKPISLMRYLTRLVTPKGGTVLDPFMGSGTTGIACVLENFDFIGIELDPEYIKIAEARIKHYTQYETLV